MEIGVIVKNVIIVFVILAVVFLSQQPYFRKLAVSSPLFKKVGPYVAKTKDWLNTNLYPGINRGAAGLWGKKEDLKNKVDAEKNNVEKNSFDTFKKYLAKKVLEALGLNPASCNL